MPSLPWLQEPEFSWYQKSVYLVVEASLLQLQLSSCISDNGRESLLLGAGTAPQRQVLPHFNLLLKLKMITGLGDLFSEDVNSPAALKYSLGIGCDHNV